MCTLHVSHIFPQNTPSKPIYGEHKGLFHPGFFPFFPKDMKEKEIDGENKIAL